MVEVNQSEVVFLVYDHPVFVEIERLIDTQNALEEEMKRTIITKVTQSDFLRVSPFVEVTSDGAEWLETQLQQRKLAYSACTIE